MILCKLQYKLVNPILQKQTIWTKTFQPFKFINSLKKNKNQIKNILWKMINFLKTCKKQNVYL